MHVLYPASWWGCAALCWAVLCWPGRCFFYDVLVGNKLTAASGLQLPVTSVGLRLAVTSPSLHQHTTADQAEAGAAD